MTLQPLKCNKRYERIGKEAKFSLTNGFMKEYLRRASSDADPIFYQQNEFNKALPLPFFYYKNHKSCCPKQALKCFGEFSPISCPPRVPRTKVSTRARSPGDVIQPHFKTLHKTYTLKVDKKFLRKE
ncbi:CLUMA_CG006759, isoform A [Clunio marinus]|uniref:CLUMA_CG006759, isoform A n=1 Tax=Clunio marinus TaxID=568069 RepID=A0A1J1HYP0_9DIPT|nr:CLUMA_CG006759, isoform A [Clunio marinus]